MEASRAHVMGVASKFADQCNLNLDGHYSKKYGNNINNKY